MLSFDRIVERKSTYKTGAPHSKSYPPIGGSFSRTTGRLEVVNLVLTNLYRIVAKLLLAV